MSPLIARDGIYGHCNENDKGSVLTLTSQVTNIATPLTRYALEFFFPATSRNLDDTEVEQLRWIQR